MPHGARRRANAHIIKNISVTTTIQEYRSVQIQANCARTGQDCLPHGARRRADAHAPCGKHSCLVLAQFACIYINTAKFQQQKQYRCRCSGGGVGVVFSTSVRTFPVGLVDPPAYKLQFECSDFQVSLLALEASLCDFEASFSSAAAAGGGPLGYWRVWGGGGYNDPAPTSPRGRSDVEKSRAATFKRLGKIGRPITNTSICFSAYSSHKAKK